MDNKSSTHMTEENPAMQTYDRNIEEFASLSDAGLADCLRAIAAIPSPSAGLLRAAIVTAAERLDPTPTSEPETFTFGALAGVVVETDEQGKVLEVNINILDSDFDLTENIGISTENLSDEDHDRRVDVLERARDLNFALPFDLPAGLTWEMG